MRHTITTAFAAWALAHPFALAYAQAPAASPDDGATTEPTPAPSSTDPEAPSADEAPDGGAQPPQATPPRLLRSAEPIYPESERQNGRAATVVLALTVDAEGKVSAAEIVESGGEAFDSAALVAARQLAFSPARRGDTNISARIPFRFDFQLAPPAPAAPSPEPPAPAPVSPAPESVPSEGSIDIEVEGERRAREPTRRSLEMAEVTKLPGTNGDALRAVQNLPGLARPPGLDGVLIVRGSAPRDSQFFVDGTNVPIAYHFGGLSSVVPSEMLDHIDFYPGNFGPEYGRASGGIVDIESRAPRAEGFGGLFQLDLLDARLLAEAALSDDTRVLVAGRRSWVDAWLGPALEDSGASVTTAPVYYDYQALIEHDASEDTTLRLFALGSDDRLELLIKNPDAGDPAAGGDLLLHTGFWRVQARADTRFDEDLRWTTSIAGGKDTEQFGIGNLALDIGIYRLDLRSELRARLMPELSLTGGLDVQTGSYDVIWRAPPLDPNDDDGGGPLFGRPLNELRGDGTFFRPGAYVQAEINPAPGLSILPGLRTDYTHDAEEWTFGPRVSIRYDLPGFAQRTTLKGGVGLYHKAPEPYETLPPFGTPGVESERAWHYSLGVERELTRAFEVSVEGFYKDIDDLVVATPAALESESGINYDNQGTGRAYGGELLLRYKPEGRFFGWVAYTLSRSERKDAPDAPWERFEYDQTHILTALGSVKLGHGWQLGARFRYVTGSPYTPYVGGVADYDSGAYAPLQAAERNGERLPAFHQLDLRADKTWTFASWKLSTYLDVQNVYNRANTENIDYNFDYSERKPLPGLPILPVLGIRGEL